MGQKRQRIYRTNIGKAVVTDAQIKGNGVNGMDDLDAMKYEEQGLLLELLADIQRNSAPIELSIGWINYDTVQQGIVIKSAPPLVTQKLVEAGYELDIMPQGVRVYKVR